ncbi:MAG: hypothetical protein H6752_18950 [Candidatus Omnitrophica bacterium]|nr:hypothetical protein [Candidatus Omnitrophota bacterium]
MKLSTPRVLATLMILVSMIPAMAEGDRRRIHVYPENPRYWEYEGAPVVLIGGSVEDNLFQIPDLEGQLDLLSEVGGNYVRCTMSCRDEGNVWPFREVDGSYDLDQWNEEFWNRFEKFLRLTSERDIIAQIEVWATFDYYRDNWDRNPFNPKNNRNYSAEESGLPTVVNSHPLQLENNFFWSVPSERNQENVLKYQRRFVEKLLSYSLQYGNVLYCMDNETAVTPEWGKYWAIFIQEKAEEAGVHVETTEMWDPWDLNDPKHRNTFDHPEIYSFVDISQNNHQKGQAHWDNAQKQRERIKNHPRPLNNVKIYGSDAYNFGNDRDGIERFWRNILGGLASARFHRPPSGLGLGEKAQSNLRSMRGVLDRIDPFHCEPHDDLLKDREENEAYCFANPGVEYVVYFPKEGMVNLKVPNQIAKWDLEWVNILTSEWKASDPMESSDQIELSSPGNHWAVVIRRGSP